MKHVGTAGAHPLWRKAFGDSPTMSWKVRLKVPRLLKPTSKQMSVTLRSVARRRNIARSRRRRWRYRCGVSPNVARKVRMKCASDTSAMRASRGMQRGSANVRSIASLARSIRRLHSSTDRLIKLLYTRCESGTRILNRQEFLLAREARNSLSASGALREPPGNEPGHQRTRCERLLTRFARLRSQVQSPRPPCNAM